jgi:hypothetical protein
VADTRDVADLPSLCLPVRESLGVRVTDRDVVTDGVSLRDSVSLVLELADGVKDIDVDIDGEKLGLGRALVDLLALSENLHECVG